MPSAFPGALDRNMSAGLTAFPTPMAALDSREEHSPGCSAGGPRASESGRAEKRPSLVAWATWLWAPRPRSSDARPRLEGMSILRGAKGSVSPAAGIPGCREGFLIQTRALRTRRGLAGPCRAQPFVGRLQGPTGTHARGWFTIDRYPKKSFAHPWVDPHEFLGGAAAAHCEKPRGPSVHAYACAGQPKCTISRGMCAPRPILDADPATRAPRLDSNVPRVYGRAHACSRIASLPAGVAAEAPGASPHRPRLGVRTPTLGGGLAAHARTALTTCQPCSSAARGGGQGAEVAARVQTSSQPCEVTGRLRGGAGGDRHAINHPVAGCSKSFTVGAPNHDFRRPSVPQSKRSGIPLGLLWPMAQMSLSSFHL